MNLPASIDFPTLVSGSLAEAAVRSLVVAGAAFLLLAAFRVRSSSVRHAAWTLVSCAMLILPILSPVLPPLPLRLLPASFAGGTALAPVLNSGPAPGSSAGGASTAAHIAQTEASSGLDTDWKSAAAVAYVAVALVLLVRLMASATRLRRLLRSSRVISDLRVFDAMDRVAAHQAVSRLPVLYESDLAAVPVTTGWMNPKLFLPAGWPEWSDRKLRAVLAHELAHIRRADYLTALLAALNNCVFWFHPLAWWLQRHLAALSEEACDDAAVLVTGDRNQYAEVLLSIASDLSGRRSRLAWENLAMARSSQVSRRIERILDMQSHVSATLTKTGWAILLATAVPALYPAASLQIEGRSAEVPRMSISAIDRQVVHIAPPQVPRSVAPTQGGTVQGHAVHGSDAYETLVFPSQRQPLPNAEVEQLKGQLEINPSDLVARVRLIKHYFFTGADQQRTELILWLIQNHPDSDVLSLPSDSPRSVMSLVQEYERAKALWLDQADRHSENAWVLSNAARFFEPTADLEHAIRIIKRGAQIQPDETYFPIWLGRIYALNIIRTSMANPAQISALFLPPSSLIAQMRAELETSTDANFVGIVGGMLVTTPRLSASEVEFGKRLLRKARSLQPNDLRWRAVLNRLTESHQAVQGAPVESAVPDRIRVGKSVQATMLLNRVPPRYPALAKQARIQGTVRFTLLIGKDGRVLEAGLVNGHPLLVESGSEAVLQWVYQPTLLNGQPVEVTTQADVNFTLSADQTGPPVALQPVPRRQPTTTADWTFGVIRMARVD